MKAQWLVIRLIWRTQLKWDVLHVRFIYGLWIIKMGIRRQNPIPWTYFSSHRHSVPSLFMFHMWYSFLYTLLLYSFLWKLTISYPGIVCRYIREYLVNILLIDCLANIVFMTVKFLTALTARPYIIFIHKLMFFFFWGHFWTPTKWFDEFFQKFCSNSSEVM